MKKIIYILIPLVFFIANSYSQTKKEIREITKNYDIQKIKQFSIEQNEKFIKDKKEALRMAEIKHWPIQINKEGVFMKLVAISNEGLPMYFKTSNVAAAKSTRTNTLHNNGLLGLNLEGQNMTAYVWDGGLARASHQEYDGVGGNDRYSIIDGGNLGINFHASHVTGTIIASGVRANAKGMAPQASCKGADWDNDLSEMSTQSLNGMLISNHSYSIQPNPLPAYRQGRYVTRSRSADMIMYNAPYYLIVTAAGNEGYNTDNSEPMEGNSGFDKLISIGLSKNNLVIANAQDVNVDDNGELLTSISINLSSSQGPTDDYRIKPDITGNGTNVYSTFDNADDAYSSISGTSMASPNVTGTLLLLQQHYNNVNGNFMKAATLKGLALHTADDAGIVGPDAIFGWGLLNAKKAAEVITQNGEYTIIEEITLSPGQTYTSSVTSDGISKFIASISWTDPAGTVNDGTIPNDSTPILVNDLDIRVTKNGNTFFPYKLTSVNTNTTSDNVVDPYERVDVDGASGNYTITVTHKGSLTGGEQNFSLIVTGLQYSGICNADDPTNLNATLFFGDANFTWDNVVGATYEVRYRPVSDTNWTTVSSDNESLTVSGLSGVYVAQVRSVCDVSTFSNWVTFENQPSFVLRTDDYINNNFIKIYSENENLIIKSIGNNNISNVTVFSILGKKLYSNSPNNRDFTISKSDIGDEKFIIVRMQLDNGTIINKKILI